LSPLPFAESVTWVDEADTWVWAETKVDVMKTPQTIIRNTMILFISFISFL
jgi:hypothetical protein